MTWLILSLLGLVSSWLLYPNYQWINTIINTNEQIQQLYIDEFEQNHQEEQKQIIINDYFLFADKLGKITYARWCAGKYGMGTQDPTQWKYNYCSPKSFDCGWAMKAYLVAKWIQTKQDISHMNSQTLYELGTPKDPRTAEKWDFMYRRWYGDVDSGNQSTHFAVVYSGYDGNSMWIYDNIVPWGQDQYNPHKIKLTCDSTMCHYLGKYRIYVATNWAIELANKLWIEVQPRIDTTPEEKPMSIIDKDNPLGYKITIKWYPYDSIANQVSNWRYDNSSWDVDMISTRLCENGWFNPNSVSQTNDHWLCQLNYNKTNSKRIDDTERLNIDFQKVACLAKRNAVQNKNLWACYSKREKYKERIVYMK